MLLYPGYREITRVSKTEHIKTHRAIAPRFVGVRKVRTLVLIHRDSRVVGNPRTERSARCEQRRLSSKEESILISMRMSLDGNIKVETAKSLPECKVALWIRPERTA